MGIHCFFLVGIYDHTFPVVFMTVDINTVSYTSENNEMFIIKFWNPFQQFLLFSDMCLPGTGLRVLLAAIALAIFQS